MKIILTIPKDVVAKITDNYNPKNKKSDLDEYFWNLLHEDLMTVSQICEKIKLYVNDLNDNLMIKLYLNLETSNYNEKRNKLPLRYRDLRIMLNFIYKILKIHFCQFVNCQLSNVRRAKPSGCLLAFNFRYFSFPSRGTISPFPHGTSSLSVATYI